MVSPRWPSMLATEACRHAQGIAASHLNSSTDYKEAASPVAPPPDVGIRSAQRPTSPGQSCPGRPSFPQRARCSVLKAPGATVGTLGKRPWSTFLNLSWVLKGLHRRRVKARRLTTAAGGVEAASGGASVSMAVSLHQEPAPRPATEPRPGQEREEAGAEEQQEPDEPAAGVAALAMQQQEREEAAVEEQQEPDEPAAGVAALAMQQQEREEAAAEEQQEPDEPAAEEQQEPDEPAAGVAALAMWQQEREEAAAEEQQEPDEPAAGVAALAMQQQEREEPEPEPWVLFEGEYMNGSSLGIRKEVREALAGAEVRHMLILVQQAEEAWVRSEAPLGSVYVHAVKQANRAPRRTLKVLAPALAMFGLSTTLWQRKDANRTFLGLRQGDFLVLGKAVEGLSVTAWRQQALDQLRAYRGG